MQTNQKTPPLRVSLKAPGRPPLVVTFKGQTARGIRDVAKLRAISEAEAAALLIRCGSEFARVRGEVR